MKFFNFFKKTSISEKTEEDLQEKVNFSEISKWIEKKTNENEVKEKRIILEVKEKIEIFNKEIEEKLKILKNFDLESKKEEVRIKFIVNEGRSKYIDSIEIFLKNLNNLNEKKIETLTKKINNIFFNFNKNSLKNYEKATILIGKEMANLKNCLNEFSRELSKIFEKNQSIANFFKIISVIESKKSELFSINKKIKLIDETKEFFNKKSEEKTEENKRLLEEIKKIKESSEYKRQLEIREKIKLLDEELNDKISELNQIINFKSLANFFHANPKKMNFLKNYKENFEMNLRRENGESFMSLLDEANEKNKIVLESYNKIKLKKIEIENCKREIKEDETQKINYKIDMLNGEINSIRMESIREEKIWKNFIEEKILIVELLKKEFKKINVELIKS